MWIPIEIDVGPIKWRNPMVLSPEELDSAEDIIFGRTKPDESITYQSDEDSGAVLVDLTSAIMGDEGRQPASYRGFIFNPNSLKYDIRL